MGLLDVVGLGGGRFFIFGIALELTVRGGEREGCGWAGAGYSSSCHKREPLIIFREEEGVWRIV